MIDIVNCSFPPKLKKNLKTYTPAAGISSEILRELRENISDGNELVYNSSNKKIKFKCKSNVFIRLTNPGALYGFERKYALGKPLWAKAKSSDAYLCMANIAASPLLAKNYKSKGDFEGIKKDLKGSKKRLKEESCAIVNKYLLTWPNHPLHKIENLINKKKPTSYKIDNTTCSNAFLLKEKIRGLHIHYLLLEETNSIRDDTGKSSALKVIYRKSRDSLRIRAQEKLRIFSVYIHIEGASDESDYDCVSEPKEFNVISIIANKGVEKLDFYPLRVMAEQWKGKYYEMLADYDLFAVCPSFDSINMDNMDAFFPSRVGLSSNKVSYNTWIDNNDKKKVGLIENANDKKDSEWLKHLSSIEKDWLDADYDEGINMNELGIISWFENEVRKLINQTFEIPVARHGCEVNNLYYTSKASDVKYLINIANDSVGRPHHLKKLTTYLHLNSDSSATAKPYFIPCNPNWVNWASSSIPKTVYKKLFSVYKGSISNKLAEIVIRQIGRKPKHRVRGRWFRSNRIHPSSKKLKKLDDWRFRVLFNKIYYQILNECDRIEINSILVDQGNKGVAQKAKWKKRNELMNGIIKSLNQKLRQS